MLDGGRVTKLSYKDPKSSSTNGAGPRGCLWGEKQSPCLGSKMVYCIECESNETVHTYIAFTIVGLTDQTITDETDLNNTLKKTPRLPDRNIIWPGSCFLFGLMRTVNSLM